MPRRPNWKTRLEPFAQKLAAMQNDIAAMLSSQDDKEIKKIISACRRPTETNCWWATFRIADTVKTEAEVILHRRRRDAKNKVK